MKKLIKSPRDLKPLLRRPAVLGGLAGVVLAAILIINSFSGGEETTDNYFEVTRDDFMVSIVESGTLEALDEVVVRSEVEYNTKILKIVPEGSQVKKGELLVELDGAEIEERLTQQQITFENSEFNFIATKEQLLIQKSEAESQIKAAELAMEFAMTDLEKYKQGEWPQQKRTAEIDIITTEEQLILAQTTFEASERLVAKGFETKRKLDQDKLAVTQWTLKVEQAKENLRILETFDYPKNLRKFEADLKEAQEQLQRVKQQTAAKLAQSEADLRSRENTLELNRTKLEYYKLQLARCKIFAPSAGMVVYPYVRSYSSQSMIEEGASVRNRQELIKLPDSSKMLVEVKVHESHVNQVSPGLPAYITIDPLPDQRFKAVVRKVAPLPDTQSRFGNPDLKVYSTDVVVIEDLPDIKPGVSAKAEIIITNLVDVIKIPIQSVTTESGVQVCYVDQGGGKVDARKVEVGLFNTEFIEIKSGLEPGDRVLLSPPVGKDAEGLLGNIVRKGEKVTTDHGGEVPESKAAPAPAPASEGGEGAGQKGKRMSQEERLKRFDKNGDGQIDDSEREAMRAQFSKGRPQGGGGGGRNP